MKIQEALTGAAKQLAKVGIENAARDARTMMAAALDIEPGRVILFLNDTLKDGQAQRFAAMVEQRLERIPVSHIVLYRDFYGRSFFVNDTVLDPRPETECLVEQALLVPFMRVLDLGTGSGAILMTLLLEVPMATGLGIDISADALAVAQDNPTLLDNQLILDLETRAGFLQSDWFEKVDGQFDLIVSNPPYIAASEMADLQPEVRDHEPRLALTDEGDGLEAYRAITSGVWDHLTAGGHLMVEIGPTQGRAVADMFSAAGLTAVKIMPDLDGRDRVVRGQKSA